MRHGTDLPDVGLCSTGDARGLRGRSRLQAPADRCGGLQTGPSRRRRATSMRPGGGPLAIRFSIGSSRPLRRETSICAKRMGGCARRAPTGTRRPADACRRSRRRGPRPPIEISGHGEIPVQRIPGFQRTFDLYDVGFDASWEIDLWGRVSREVQASNARSDAAREARRDVLLQTIAEVVRAYVDLREAQARLASASADALARDRTASLVGQRYHAGEASLFDDARAAGAGALDPKRAPGTRLRREGRSLPPRASHGPAARGPRRARRQGRRRCQTPPARVGVGLRSDLLRRRPDVRQAERNLAAATADVGVATADLFPRVTLDRRGRPTGAERRRPDFQTQHAIINSARPSPGRSYRSAEFARRSAPLAGVPIRPAPPMRRRC